MKVLEFIQSLLVPTHMIKRKNMKVFIGILILILCSLIMSIPIGNNLSKHRYDYFEEFFDIDILEYVDDNSTNPNNAFTEEELSKYNMVRFSDLKALQVIIENTDGIQNLDKGVEDAKEYVLKAVKPIYDEEGTYVSDEITYIHVVFDFKQEENDKVFNISEKFNKIPNLEEKRFGHILLLFNDKSFTFKTTVENGVLSNITYYKNINFNFITAENMKEIALRLVDTLIPLYKFTYRIYSFVFVGLFTLLIAMIFSFVLRDSGQIKGFKQYINMASIASIPFTIFAFAFSFINSTFCNLFFKWYSAFFGIYFFVVVIIMNRRIRIE